LRSSVAKSSDRELPWLRHTAISESARYSPQRWAPLNTAAAWFLRGFANRQRVSRRRLCGFDRARHQVFSHRAFRRQDRM